MSKPFGRECNSVELFKPAYITERVQLGYFGNYVQLQQGVVEYHVFYNFECNTDKFQGQRKHLFLLKEREMLIFLPIGYPRINIQQLVLAGELLF